MASTWTPERRARQAELIKTWQPWSKATGPVTAEGKTKSSMNAYRGGFRPLLRELGALLHGEVKTAQDLAGGLRAHVEQDCDP
jgi:hypothetical protein